MSSKDFDWKLVHLALFRVRADEHSIDEKPKLHVEHLSTQKHFEQSQVLLEEMLDRLLSNAWGKKVDINDASTCRAYGFRDTTDGKRDRELMGELVGGASKEDFESRALQITERYTGLDKAREGIMIHAVTTVDAGRAKSLPFYFMFKCDFEDARQLADDSNLVPVPEVILEKLKKMAMYPYFDGFAPDAERVKLFQQSAGDNFHEIFEIDMPATAKELFQKELARAVATRFEDKYDDYFVGMPEGKRELFGQDRIIPLDDLMPAPEVKFVSDKTVRAAKDKYDKPLKVRIKIDETVAIEADMSGLGKTFFFAQKGDLRYLIIRGEKFVSAGPLTGLDFLDVEQLEDILPRVTEDVGGGFSEDV